MVLHSLADLKPTPEIELRSIEVEMFRWALAPDIRAVRTTSGQIMHKRFETKTVKDLIACADSYGPLAPKIKNTVAFRACKLLLCDERERPGVPVRV